MTSFQAKELAPYPGEFVVLRCDAEYSRRIDTHGRFTQTDAQLFAESLNVWSESGLTPRQLLAQRDELERQLRDLLVAVKYKTPPVAFGDGNYCYEARVPVAFVDNAEAALAECGKD